MQVCEGWVGEKDFGAMGCFFAIMGQNFGAISGKLTLESPEHLCAVRNLTGFFNMRKKQASKRLGRDEVISDADLLKRYGALRQFLEWNWGRIGLKLQRIRKPGEVSAAIKVVPGIEWLPAFRDHKAWCFANSGSDPVRFQQVRNVNRKYDEAKRVKENLWSDFHSSAGKLHEGETSLKIAFSEIGNLGTLFPIFYYLFAIGACVEEMRREFETVKLRQQNAHIIEEALARQRSEHEAWFAQNEILNMKRAKRYAMTPENLARAMAGMPEYGWLNSLRRCQKLRPDALAPSAYPYQLFQMITRIVRRMKPLKLQRVEMRLRDELLKESNTFLRECIKPNWASLKQAFSDITGKKFTRAVLPFLIVGRFLELMEKGKSPMEREIAKHAEAELSIATN